MSNTAHKLKIGLTYDLRTDYLADGFSEEETAELDSELTINAIEAALLKLGHQTERIGGIKTLTKKLADGNRWDLVFNISEGFFGNSREAQIPALLDAYEIPYTFSEPLTLCLALDKPAAKRFVRDHNINTADFYVVKSPDDLSNVTLPYPVFCKPANEGSSKGISAFSYANNHQALQKTVTTLLKQFRQPVLIEEYLPGREYTVGIIGTDAKARVLGVMEIRLNTSKTEGYSYGNKVNYLDKVTYRLADAAYKDECGELALAAWRALGCRDGGRVDIKYDAFNHPAFIEVNPLAGLNPEYSDLPIMCKLLRVSYDMLIGEILASAIGRIQ